MARPRLAADEFGGAFLWVSLAIVFVECGLFFPFLPGDTLLFALGLFIAGDEYDVLGIDNKAAGLSCRDHAAARSRRSSATSSATR